MNIKIKVKDENVKTPAYATDGSAGLDLYAHSFLKLFKGQQEVDLNKVLQNSIKSGYIYLRAKERLLIGTGIYMEIPIGYEMQIRPRSGLALNKGITVINSPGTIDSDYRDEIGIILVNTTDFFYKINLGDKIAQGVIASYSKVTLEKIEELNSTDRLGGFGSTGNK
jgi:dUTP pyrophosphatase